MTRTAIHDKPKGGTQFTQPVPTATTKSGGLVIHPIGDDAFVALPVDEALGVPYREPVVGELIRLLPDSEELAVPE